MAVFDFDPTQYKESVALEAMPAGWYPAVMTESEVVATSKGDGFRLKVKFRIIDGPCKDRVVETGYNIQNPSPQAVEISMSDLKSIASSVGVFTRIQDSAQLHNLPLLIKLTKKPDADYNDVKGYKTINGAEPGSGIALVPTMPHQTQPPQGYGQPPAPQTPYAPAPPPPPPAAADPSVSWQRTPDNAYKLNPATNAWEPNSQAPPPPPAASAPPAWAPPVAAAAPPAPPVPGAPAQWAPNPAPVAPPSWVPPTR